MPQVLPGQGHTLRDCACCHPDAEHQAFSNAVGTGEFVLCQECNAENWEPQKEGAERDLVMARANAAANPGSDAHALALELCEGQLEIYKSKNGNEWDLPRLNAAYLRVAAAHAAIAALTGQPKGAS